MLQTNLLQTNKEITKLEIQNLLEWAGMKLLSLPISGIRPSSYKNNWPSFANDANVAYGFSNLRLRPPPPNGHEIDLLDKIFDLVIFIDNITYRRILQARSLVNPISHKYVYHWIQIAELVNSDRRTVRRWHGKGLEQIIKNTNPSQINYLKSQIK